MDTFFVVEVDVTNKKKSVQLNLGKGTPEKWNFY